MHCVPSALKSKRPVNVLILMPTPQYLCTLCQTYVFQAFTYTIAQGTTKRLDLWSMVCIQNAKAAVLRPICHATVPTFPGPHLKKYISRLWTKKQVTKCFVHGVAKTSCLETRSAASWLHSLCRALLAFTYVILIHQQIS